MGRLFIAALAIAAQLPPAGGNAPADCTFCDEPRTGPGDGCYPCDEGMCGPSTATTGFGPSDFCPDGRQYLCQTYLTSPSIYVANLTNMTVGMNLTGGSPCPAEWIRDTVIPYPAAPDFECYETYPDGSCVPSMCTGTPCSPLSPLSNWVSSALLLRVTPALPSDSSPLSMRCASSSVWRFCAAWCNCRSFGKILSSSSIFRTKTR